MTKKEVAQKYIKFLAHGNTQKIIDLFEDKAIVHSPVYGAKQADKFYAELSGDTTNSALNLIGIFEEDNSNRLALYFKYKWTLKSEKTVEFEVVDIMEFNNKNKIKELKIIYDTVISRVLVKEIKNNSASINI